MRTALKIVLAVSLAFAVCLAAQPAALAQSDGLTVVKYLSPEQQAAAASFWTPARIAAAKPMKMPVDYGTPPAAVLEEEVAVQDAPGSSPSGPAMPGANAIARAAYPEAWAALAGAEAPADQIAGTSGVYTYYDVNVSTTLGALYPHKTVGRLSFTTPGGTGYCSATAISNNHIVTAAHCVYDTTTNTWYSNWVFSPSYRAGVSPYGTFPAHHARILTAYINLTGSYSVASWARHDVAIIQLNANNAGQTINQAVGYAGRSWDWGYTNLHFNAGYPFRNYQNVSLGTTAGYYLRSCTAESFTLTTDTLGSGCYFGPGISGGPWFRVYRPAVSGANNYVNSVNSGLYIGQQNLYGARFNSNNIVLLCTADGC